MKDRIPPVRLSPEQADLFAAMDAWNWVRSADRHAPWFRVPGVRDSIQSRTIRGFQYRITRLEDLRTGDPQDRKFIVSEAVGPVWVFRGWIHGPTLEDVHAQLWVQVWERDGERPILAKV